MIWPIKRQVSGFAIPVVMLLLAVVGWFMAGYYQQQQLMFTQVEMLQQANSHKQLIRQREENALSLFEQENFATNGGYIAVIMDGLVNMAHSIDSFGPGQPQFVDKDHFAVLQRRLLACGVDPQLAHRLYTWMGQRDTGFRVIHPYVYASDLGLDLATVTRMLYCVRLAPDLARLNLYFANAETLAAVFDVSMSVARSLYQQLQDHHLVSVNQVVNWLQATIPGREFGRGIVHQLSYATRPSQVMYLYEKDGQISGYVDIMELQQSEAYVAGSEFLWVE